MKKIIYLVGLCGLVDVGLASNPEMDDPVCSLKATDNSTEAEGTREGESSLVMVKSDEDRTAEIIVTLEEGEFCEGYPKWSGITVTDGERKGDYSGKDDKTITVTLGPGGASEKVKISIFPELDSSTSWSFDDPKLKKIKDALNAAIKKIAGKDTKIDGSGSVGYTAKVVDFYNDGSKVGGILGLDGTIELTFPDVKFQSPYVRVPGVSFLEVAIGGSFTASKIDFVADTNYDQSKENPGSVTGSLTGETIATLEGKARGAQILVVTLTGSSKLTASGTLGLANKKVDLTGKIAASDFTAAIAVDLTTWVGDYELYNKEHEFKFSASESLTITLHEFKE